VVVERQRPGHADDAVEHVVGQAGEARVRRDGHGLERLLGVEVEDGEVASLEERHQGPAAVVPHRHRERPLREHARERNWLTTRPPLPLGGRHPKTTSLGKNHVCAGVAPSTLKTPVIDGALSSV
jgi:hypothetical protein